MDFMKVIDEPSDIDYSLALKDHAEYTASAPSILFKLLHEVENEYKIPLRLAIWLWFLGKQ